MPLKIIAGSLDVRSPNISFRVDDGEGGVACGISRDALLDLAGHHGLRGSAQGLFHALWPVIARLLGTKFRAGRVEPDGEVLIGGADLLLYGFDETEPPVREWRGSMAMAAKAVESPTPPPLAAPHPSEGGH